MLTVDADEDTRKRFQQIVHGKGTPSSQLELLKQVIYAKAPAPSYKPSRFSTSLR